MEKVMVQVFEVHELPAEVVEKAHATWVYEEATFGSFGSYVWDESYKSLEAFAEVFGVELRDVSEFGVCFVLEDVLLGALCGVRLATWLHNNVWDHITKGRYYSLWSKTTPNKHYTAGGFAPKGALKMRRSNVMYTTRGACPFTGMYMDDTLLEPVWHFLAAPQADTDYYDLIDACMAAWVEALHAEQTHVQSLEYFMEIAEINDFRFTADGSRYHA